MMRVSQQFTTIKAGGKLSRDNVLRLAEQGNGAAFEIVDWSLEQMAWFTFDPISTHPDVELATNNITIACGNFDHRVAIGNVGFSKGIHYWEVTLDCYTNNTDSAIGICRLDVDTGLILGKDDKAWSMYIDEKRSWFLHRDAHTNRLEGGVREGSTIGVLLDLNQHIMSYSVNGLPHGPIAFTDLHGVFFPAVSINRNVQVTLKTGLTPPSSVLAELYPRED